MEDATQSASSSPHDFRTRSRSRSGSVETREPCFAGVAGLSRPCDWEDGHGQRQELKEDKQDFKLSEEEDELVIN